jgi:hypothetical protein
MVDATQLAEVQAEYEELQRLFAEMTGVRVRELFLGDGQGNLYDSANPGRMYVRENTGQGTSSPFTIMADGTFAVAENLAVVAKRDHRGQWVIARANGVTQVEQGVNPIVNNPADQSVFGWVDTNKIIQLLSQPSGDGLKVVVNAYMYLRNGTVSVAGKQSIDLASYVPSNPGEHRLVAIFLTRDNDLMVGAADAKSQAIPITRENRVDTDGTTLYSDVQQCIRNSTPGSEWCSAWRLEYGQTTLNETAYLDGREFISFHDATALYTQPSVIDVPLLVPENRHAALHGGVTIDSAFVIEGALIMKEV